MLSATLVVTFALLHQVSGQAGIQGNSSNLTSANTTNTSVTPSQDDHDRDSDLLRLAPKPSRLSRLACVFDNTSHLENSSARPTIEDFNATFCTDVYYHETTLEVMMIYFKHTRLPHFISINNVKVDHPHVRTFLTVSDPGGLLEKSEIFRRGQSFARFASNTAHFIRLWGFDGLNVNLPYPEDPLVYTSLIEHLNHAFIEEAQRSKADKLLLAAVVTGDRDIAETLYESRVIPYMLDQINIKTYGYREDRTPNETKVQSPLFDSSYRGTKSSGTLVTSPLLQMNLQALELNELRAPMPVVPSCNQASPALDSEGSGCVEGQDANNLDKDLDSSKAKSRVRRAVGSTSGTTFGHHNLDASIRHWVWMGADKKKINVMISLSGTAYDLQNPSLTGVGAPVTTAGNASGRLVSRQELTPILCAATVPVHRANTWVKAPYVVINATTWVSFEDAESISQKVEYLMREGIMGVMLMHQGEDRVPANCPMDNFSLHALVHAEGDIGLPIDHWLVHVDEEACSRAGHTTLFVFGEWTQWTMYLSILIALFGWFI